MSRLRFCTSLAATAVSPCWLLMVKVTAQRKIMGDTWLEVGIGGNITLGKNCELYGDVERSFGGDVTKNWGTQRRLRYSF